METELDRAHAEWTEQTYVDPNELPDPPYVAPHYVIEWDEQTGYEKFKHFEVSVPPEASLSILCGLKSLSCIRNVRQTYVTSDGMRIPISS